MEKDNDMEEKITMEDPGIESDSNKNGPDLKCILISILFITLLIIIIAVLILVLFSSSTPSNEDKDTDPWSDSYKKSKDFVSKLNLQEKLSLFYGTENCFYNEKCTGQLDAFTNDKISFPGMCLQDGPAGVRQSRGTSVSWHASINTAATFNKELMYLIGKSQGEENKLKGVNVMLSPSVTIVRTPQAGRIWEGYGEDPFYSGVCATQIVKGIQDAGVIATIKHFAANDQETYRGLSSSDIELQTLMDVYIEPFYRPVKEANVGAVMCGYNLVNNIYNCENKFLLTDVLRGILNFKGFVMSDWWAILTNTSNTFNHGTDVNMPGGFGYGTQYIGRNNSYWSNIETYIKEGVISEERVNEAATRILATMYKLDQMESYPKVNLTFNTLTDERVALQRKAATESQVLLKNDGILPIKNVKSISVIGNDAFPRDCINGDSDMQCRNSTNEVSNGHIPLGYGSGTTNFAYIVTPLDGISKLAKDRNISVTSSGNLIYTDEDRDGVTVHVSAVEDIENGVKVANESDIAIVFVAADSGEGYLRVETTKGERLNLDVFHNGNELIEAIAEVNENVVVVINGPCVVNMPWLDKVKAVVFSGFPGMESGNAIADVLFGVYNPSGHIPYAWGKLEEYGVPYIVQEEEPFDPKHEIVHYNYSEGLYVGQRWFNKQKTKPLFPFGWGLTYSSFEYSDLSLSMNKEGLKATFYVTNNSTVTGSAVPMMFVTFPESIGDYPKYIFKGFEKVEIKEGEKKKVEILADDHALSYFNLKAKNYVRVNEGVIKVSIAENGDPDQSLLSGEIDAKY